MRLQNLKDELAKGRREWFPNPLGAGMEPSGAISLAWVVASRVADLYDECPNCHGIGVKPEQIPVLGVSDSDPCSRCEGRGLVPTPPNYGLFASEFASVSLARYLFGEES